MCGTDFDTHPVLEQLSEKIDMVFKKMTQLHSDFHRNYIRIPISKTNLFQICKNTLF